LNDPDPVLIGGQDRRRFIPTASPRPTRTLNPTEPLVVGWCLVETSEFPRANQAERRATGGEDFSLCLEALLDGLERRLFD
jgi:hypothetical protein